MDGKGMYGGGIMPGNVRGQQPGANRGKGLSRSEDLIDDIQFGKVYNHKVVTRLLKYLSDYKVRFIVAAVSMILFTVSTVAMPWLVGLAINGYIYKSALTGLELTVFNIIGADFLNWLFFFIGNGLLNWGSQWLQLLSMAYIGRGIFYKLRTQMFNHLQTLSLSFYDRHEVGRIMSRVQNDVNSIQEVVTNGIINTVSDILTLIVIIFVLFTMDAKLALITMTVIPVLAVILIVWQNYAKNAFMRVRQAISVVNAGLQENISGAKVIQSLSREDENFRRFDTVNEENLDANMAASKLSAGLLPIVELIMGVAIALVIIYGGIQTLGGTLLLGHLVSFVIYVQRFFEPVRRLSMQYTQLQRAMAGGQRIFEVLDTKPEIFDTQNAIEMPVIKGEISFDHVSFEYVEGLEILHDINLHIKPGETIALVGSTGAGKSTFVSLVDRFYQITSGVLKIDGYDIDKVTQESLRRQISVVLQDPFLFSGTVKENILYGREGASEEEIIMAAKAVGADRFIQRLENGYDTELQERGSSLSVGQRQLISFARAILSDPRILILDEATANVDTQTEVIVQRALRKLLKGRTSLVIAHRLSTIHDASRVIVLQDGKIAEIGSHEELLEKEGIYHHLYTMSYASAASDN